MSTSARRGLTAAARSGRFRSEFIERSIHSPFAQVLDFSGPSQRTEAQTEPRVAAAPGALAIDCDRHGAVAGQPCFGRAGRPSAAVCAARATRGIAARGAS